MPTTGVNLKCEDPYVCNVITKYVKRSETGLRKYGTTLERTDLSEEDWLIHLQEELMDASLYVEKLLDVIRKRLKKT